LKSQFDDTFCVKKLLLKHRKEISAGAVKISQCLHLRKVIVYSDRGEMYHTYFLIYTLSLVKPEI
jgi:hypothetical protein